MNSHKKACLTAKGRAHLVEQIEQAILTWLLGRA